MQLFLILAIILNSCFLPARAEPKKHLQDIIERVDKGVRDQRILQRKSLRGLKRFQYCIIVLSQHSPEQMTALKKLFEKLCADQGILVQDVISEGTSNQLSNEEGLLSVSFCNGNMELDIIQRSRIDRLGLDVRTSTYSLTKYVGTLSVKGLESNLEQILNTFILDYLAANLPRK